MLRLLPPVCRDCGKSAEAVSLSPYLDFRLCAPCALARDRAVVSGSRRRPASAPGKKPAAKPKYSVKPKAAAKPAPKKLAEVKAAAKPKAAPKKRAAAKPAARPKPAPKRPAAAKPAGKRKPAPKKPPSPKPAPAAKPAPKTPAVKRGVGADEQRRKR